jgi:hypothetical protein
MILFYDCYINAFWTKKETKKAKKNVSNVQFNSLVPFYGHFIDAYRKPVRG